MLLCLATLGVVYGDIGTSPFFRTMLRNSVPAHLYFGLGSDSFVTTETVHLAATAFDGNAVGAVPEEPESV